MVQLFMKDDPGKLNPLEGLGHFVCVDGFGSVSPEERAAGLPGHGEAYRVPWDLRSAERKDGTLTVVFAASLPLVQENFRRTIRMVDGESVIHIETGSRACSASIGPSTGPSTPRLAAVSRAGKDGHGDVRHRGMTRSHESQATSPPEPHQLADFKEFTWPMRADAKRRPARHASGAGADAGSRSHDVLDGSLAAARVHHRVPSRQAGPARVRLPAGGVPWTQIWDSYPGKGRRSSRGLEFATQPFDVPRREAIQTNALFGTPTYRWLPAKSTIRSSFVMFYTRTPEGFMKVDDVVLADGRLDHRGSDGRKADRPRRLARSVDRINPASLPAETRPTRLGPGRSSV